MSSSSVSSISDTSSHPFLAALSCLNMVTHYGCVRSVSGLLVEVDGIHTHAHVGTLVRIHQNNHQSVRGAVVGFRGETTLVMAYASLDGVSPTSRVDILGEGLSLRPSSAWLGRVINALGEPLDDKGPLAMGGQVRALKASPPPAHQRRPLSQRIDLGVKALNTFTTCCHGQRMGIFSGSGVGKSVLLGQITRFTSCDVVIVGLIGERGREVNEFIKNQLGEEGLKRAIIVVATSDEPALIRRQAAYATLTLAEYFRDQGKQVLCLIDSLTRFATAQREIGLSTGEPPTTRGYPPTVFSQLPQLLERAGNSSGEGSITGIFTVLVEGDDINEPVTDTVRSIVDGHIFLKRAISERGRYPAVDVLRSLSRTMPDCNTEEETQVVQEARKRIALYQDMEEMIQLGAYRKGANPEIDKAIAFHDKVEDFLSQGKTESCTLEDSFAQLLSIVHA